MYSFIEISKDNFNSTNVELRVYVKKAFEGCYYITATTKWLSSPIVSRPEIMDNYVCDIFNLKKTDYRKFLIDNFNGFQYTTFNEVFFKTEEDADGALQYLESKMVMDKMTINRGW